MPRIFDNLDSSTRLLPALQDTLADSTRADFCVGYFNLRGWSDLAPHIDRWDPDGGPCRVLIGMQKLPHDQLADALSLTADQNGMDNQAAGQLRKKLAEELRNQLTIGAPTNRDERTLRQLAAQLKARRVVVKLFLRHPLHAKLYVLYREDQVAPRVGYLGSSNLTFAGLAGQGELNIDVVDSDATQKLEKWFQDRWDDRFCVDVTDELVKIIEESWAREDLIPPYHIYLKMAYHLSHEARTGLTDFKIPAVFGNQLFDFQSAAVKIAARHLNTRDGVMIGDVVGLGKTLMATALARIFEDDYDLQTLIICPKNLVPMWEDYVGKYHLRARVLSLSRVQRELPDLRRYRLVIIDESHNLRNREGRRFRAIQEYIRENESRCILLSATPYNKTYRDLSNQLRLFVGEDADLGIRPERLLRELGEVEFSSRHQAAPRTLAAFEFSEHADDWRDLMRLYLVRRTRSFIQQNYAETDEDTGQKYLTYESGDRSYFPIREPRTVKFAVDDSDPNDQYARLYSANIVDTVKELSLPRYGLGTYIAENPAKPPSTEELGQIEGLSRAGKRLIGFCRVNLFKRLESSGAAFLQSVERHILRNYVFLHAIRNDLPLPIGTQDVEMLDSRFTDEDVEETTADVSDPEADDDGIVKEEGDGITARDFEARAEAIYKDYQGRYERRFRWLRPDLFEPDLEEKLQTDSEALLNILETYGDWDPDKDSKLNALQELLTERYPDQKVLVFSQFADTVEYLKTQLNDRGVEALAGVTGNSADVTESAWNFSPVSNNRPPVSADEEIRVLIATDVLSEGQNLQDCHVVVNYDLPWAIIRLIQRAGRVDRIGQQARQIFCHSFMPADGVEKIIDLRGRVRTRLKQNAEVVGADESFFEDEENANAIVDLYNESAGILDADPDGEVDLASHAYQIWNNATANDPQLEKTVSELPDVVYSSRLHKPVDGRPEGVLVFMRTADGNDALAYVDQNGDSITESQFEILAAAECAPETPAQTRHDDHHQLVAQGVQHIATTQRSVGGQLGRPSSARYRAYQRLSAHLQAIQGQLDAGELSLAVEDIYRFPLRSTAIDTLNRQMRSGVDNYVLADLVMSLRQEDRLCITETEPTDAREPQIICSLGLFDSKDDAE